MHCPKYCNENKSWYSIIVKSFLSSDRTWIQTTIILLATCIIIRLNCLVKLFHVILERVIYYYVRDMEGTSTLPKNKINGSSLIIDSWKAMGKKNIHQYQDRLSASTEQIAYLVDSYFEELSIYSCIRLSYADTGAWIM